MKYQNSNVDDNKFIFMVTILSNSLISSKLFLHATLKSTVVVRHVVLLQMPSARLTKISFNKYFKYLFYPKS